MKKIFTSFFFVGALLIVTFQLMKRSQKEVDLSLYSRSELKEMLEAGEAMLYWQKVLEAMGSNVVLELIKTESVFYESDHYPKGDVKDFETGSQYYYHAHRKEEHGHFHTFISQDGRYSHLVAIGMNNGGEPTKLFTTSQKITGENWRKADELVSLLPHFGISHSMPSYPTNQWISHAIKFYRPQIELLLRQRDLILNEKPEEQDKEILSSLKVDFTRHFASIKKALFSGGSTLQSL